MSDITGTGSVSQNVRRQWHITINSWQITHDPLQLSEAKTNPEQLEEAAREQGEDIIQAKRGRSTLDLGWYRDRYRMLLIEDENSSAPVGRSRLLI
jgi:hypothetical protein